ncbi:MAG: ribonucleotide reductase subunit alpha [Eggerthellaceae bacterium]
MFEGNTDLSGSPSQNNDVNDTAEYLKRAAAAVAAGDATLGMHLYLAAFEKSSRASYRPEAAAIEGLRTAWNLACSCKERSLAEYIFEKLEPFLSGDEMARNAEALQRLALDKLEEFGLTREDVEDMADMIADDFLEGSEGSASLVKVEDLTKIPGLFTADSVFPAMKSAAQLASLEQEKKATSSAATSVALPAATPAAKQGEDARAQQHGLMYKDLSGFGGAIATMRDFGIGVKKDAQYQEFLRQLNESYGINKMPATDSFLFMSDAREDANQFMAATVGELALPTVRMNMEEGPQGMPVLCVMASADHQPRLSFGRTAFEGPGVLMLEDIDLWGPPLIDGDFDDFDSFPLARLSRGAREALNLIRQAVENPEVYVLATVSQENDFEDFFFDLLDPFEPIVVDLPTTAERMDIWEHIALEHPCARGLDTSDLVRLSANMSRYDIYMAAQEAVEAAYKESLALRSYLPVSVENMYEKLAAYQPLESEEYQQLENVVIAGFSAQMGTVDDLLKGEA